MTQAKTYAKSMEMKSNRKVTLLKLGKIVLKTEVSEMVPGEFPTKEWVSFPLEIPSSGLKQHILGRFPSGFHSTLAEQGLESEVLHLPVYTGEEISDARAFESLASDQKGVLDNAKIPFITIATKCCGQYVQGRAIQVLSVLPIWKDYSSLLLELFWTEGNPEEDGINPEWHVQASPKVQMELGLDKLRGSSELPRNSVKCSYYLYVNPASLGEHVLGKGKEYQSKTWRSEWSFDDREKLLKALDELSEVICSRGD